MKIIPICSLLIVTNLNAAIIRTEWTGTISSTGIGVGVPEDSGFAVGQTGSGTVVWDTDTGIATSTISLLNADFGLVTVTGSNGSAQLFNNLSNRDRIILDNFNGSFSENNPYVNFTSPGFSFNAPSTTISSTAFADALQHLAAFNTGTISFGVSDAFGSGNITYAFNTVTHTVLVPNQTALQSWRTLHGLPAEGSGDSANPSGDGVANLLKFAFHMAASAGDLNQQNVSILAPAGRSGLPRIFPDGSGQLVVEFIRRKAVSNPGITYEVQTGSDLNALQPLSLASASIVSIDATWERVTVTDPAVSTARFGRVSVKVDPE